MNIDTATSQEFRIYQSSFEACLNKRISLAKQHEEYYEHILYNNTGAFPGFGQALENVGNSLYRGNPHLYHVSVYQISATFPAKEVVSHLAEKVTKAMEQKIAAVCRDSTKWVMSFGNPASRLAEIHADRLLTTVGSVDVTVADRECWSYYQTFKPLGVDALVERLCTHTR
jgi:hypothetical protein